MAQDDQPNIYNDRITVISKQLKRDNKKSFLYRKVKTVESPFLES